MINVFDASVDIINIYSGFCQFKNQRDLINIFSSKQHGGGLKRSIHVYPTSRKKKCSVKKEVIQDSMKESSLIPFALGIT